MAQLPFPHVGFDEQEHAERHEWRTFANDRHGLWLDLHNSKVTDAGLVSLLVRPASPAPLFFQKKLPLRLPTTPCLVDAYAAPRVTCAVSPFLLRLCLDMTGVTDAGLLALATCHWPCLNTVSLGFCEGIEDGDGVVRALVPACPVWIPDSSAFFVYYYYYLFYYLFYYYYYYYYYY